MKTIITVKRKAVHRTKVVQAPAAPAQHVQTDLWARRVHTYYGDVTSGDYSAAWALLGTQMQARSDSYGSFVAGYSGTGGQNVSEIGESGDTMTYYQESVNPGSTAQWYSCTATVYDRLMQSSNITQIAGNPQV